MTWTDPSTAFLAMTWWEHCNDVYRSFDCAQDDKRRTLWVDRSFDCAQDDRWMEWRMRGRWWSGWEWRDCHVAGLLAMTWREHCNDVDRSFDCGQDDRWTEWSMRGRGGSGWGWQDCHVAALLAMTWRQWRSSQ